MSDCPADDELVRLVEGALADASLAALEAHVAGCERCAALMAELGASGGDRRTLAGYALDRRIASGGMGEVWAAWDAELQREVAIKLVRPEHAEDPRQRARLLREARALAKLAHPNVLAVYDVGEASGEVYVATELVAGDTLASRGGPSADWRVVARLYVQAARGLAAAHAVGLVHRDVKPANLLVGADGRVRVADFGLAIGDRDAAVPVTDGAAVVAPTVTAAGAIAGTPAYMAPEQRTGGPVDARCDQFALAVALVEGIDGRRPPAGITASALRAQLAERRADAALSALADVLARALAVAPDARHADMTALADAIADAAAPPVTAPEPRPRGRVLTAIAALAAAAVAAVAMFATTHDESSPAAVAPLAATAAAAPAPAAPDPAAPAPAAPIPAPAPAAAPPAPALRKPPPPPHHASLDDITTALHHRDAAACTRAAAALDPATTAADRIELSRVHCAMLSAASDAACATATAREAALAAAATPPMPASIAQADADLYCPPSDPATRAHRLTRQLLLFRPDPTTCAQYTAPAHALAAETTDDRSRTVAGSVLVGLAKCFSEAGRCADARAALHDAGALVPAMDSPSELTADCR